MTGVYANLYSFPHSQSAYRSHCKTGADTQRLLHPVLKCSCLSRSLCTAASQHSGTATAGTAVAQAQLRGGCVLLKVSGQQKSRLLPHPHEVPLGHRPCQQGACLGGGGPGVVGERPKKGRSPPRDVPWLTEGGKPPCLLQPGLLHRGKDYT